MKDVKKFQKKFQKQQSKGLLSPQTIRTLLRSAEMEMAWKGWTASQ